MAIKNSRVRKLRRRTKALKNFATLTKEQYDKKFGGSDGWAEYATKRRQELDILTLRVAKHSR